MMARKHPRFSRFLAWSGVVACVLLAFTIVLSRSWSISWSRGNYWGFVQWGVIAFGHHKTVDEFRWNVRRNSPAGVLLWWFDYQPGNQYRAPCFITPLWLPLVMIGIPTAVFFIRNRRRFPRGHCEKCGYNLTGNLSGTCPECGTKVEQP